MSKVDLPKIFLVNENKIPITGRISKSAFHEY